MNKIKEFYIKQYLAVQIYIQENLFAVLHKTNLNNN